MRTARLTWAFLTRAGSERDLVEELGEERLPEIVAEGVVASVGRAEREDGSIADPAFARQALRLSGPPASLHPETLADRLAGAIAAHLPKSGEPWTWTLEVVAPDTSNPRDPRRRALEAIEPALKDALRARLAERVRNKETTDPREAERLVQIWAIDEERAVLGVTLAQHAVSRVPGGKVRLRRAEDAPSRSGLKLDEAIDWIGLGPDRGDLCVDLGASPGGWSQVAVSRGANVIAIDPAGLKIALPPRRFTYLKQSAFEFAPSETLDWLLCDMAWRPLEVAQLVAKWGRRAWARQMIVNFKLPMRMKAEILGKILGTLESAGWRGLRARQLYYDRDEVTVFGWLDPHVARGGAKLPFAFRGAKNAGRRDAAEATRKKTDRRARPTKGVPGRGPRQDPRKGPQKQGRGRKGAAPKGAPRNGSPRKGSARKGSARRQPRPPR